jgi:MFS family permease
MGDLYLWIGFGLLALLAPWFARNYLAPLRRDVHLWLVSAFLTGFCTMFGGTYGTLMNLYLSKLGFGPDVIGGLNGTFYIGMALVAAVSGPVITLLGGVRNAAALGMALVAVGQMLFPLRTLLGAAPTLLWLQTTLMISSAGITLYAVNIWPFMASRIEADKRAYGFAGHLGLVPVGGMVGSMLSSKISALIAGTAEGSAESHALVLAGSGVLVCVGVMALLFIPKNPQIAQEAPAAPVAPARGPVPVLIIAMMVVVMIFDVSGEGIGRVFQNVYMAKALGIPDERVGILLGYGQLPAALAVFMTPRFVNRLGLAFTFIVTTLGMSLGLALVSTVPHWLAATVGYAVLIGFSQMARAAKTQYAMEVVEEHYRPHISGFMQVAETGTVFLLAVLGGKALERGSLGFAGLFNVVALSTALAALWFWLFFVRTPRGALRGAEEAQSQT